MFSPQLVSDTALHLSTRGGSYRLRQYDLTKPSNRPRAFTIPACPSFDTLRASNVIKKWIPVTVEDLDYSIDKEPQYWCERIRTVNREYFNAENEAQSSTWSPC